MYNEMNVCWSLFGSANVECWHNLVPKGTSYHLMFVLNTNDRIKNHDPPTFLVRTTKSWLGDRDLRTTTGNGKLDMRNRK
jgi:hypothetical protein